MNIQIPLSLLPSLLFMALCLVPPLAIICIFKQQTKRKKSPLNISLLRNPGQSLREQIEDETIEIITSLLLIPAASILLYSIIITEYVSSGHKINLISSLIYLFAIVGGVSYLITKVFRMIKHRNHLRLGYDCELAVGQELSNRIRDGFFVFHDFPADGFNIDHVLVGSTGVFAIETKGRAKLRVAENENWKMEYNGKKLKFPGWTETKPIEQAKNQAQWLSQWLQKTTGSPCKVSPVLAIPGWWINRIASGDMPVYNGKDSSFLVKGQAVLSPPHIKAIAHQVDQKCRTVESSSYKQEDKDKKKLVFTSE
ncbi:MAG TPA: NERD domain-containing protein [Phycisphaerales bacterium]|nr:NERD domain-containing protein [Phycisphaerales bacterium]